MKRSKWVRLIAVILIISMLAAPVSAATNRGSDGVRTNGLIGFVVEIIRDIIRGIFDDWFDKPGDEDPVPTEPIETTAPTTPGETEPTEPGETEPGETKPTTPGETNPTEPGETEPGETNPTEPGETEPEEETPEYELNLIEGHANTENGYLLRGVTYSLDQVIAQQGEPLRATTAQKGKPLTSPIGQNSASQTPLKLLGRSSVSILAAETTIAYASVHNGNRLVALADCLYTFDLRDNGTWYITAKTADNSTIYLDPYGNVGRPFNTNAVAVTLVDGYSNNAVKFKDGNSGYLHVHTENAASAANWNQCAEDHTNNNRHDFLLYRPVSGSETSSTEIPGYVQVAANVANGSVTGIEDGDQLLVVGLHNDGSRSILHPSKSSTNSDHIATLVTGNAVTGITLNETEAEMTLGGDTLTLTATVAPADALNKVFVWSSSDTAVATVSNGVVTAVNAGSTTITATTAEGSFVASCAVTVVIDPPEEPEQPAIGSELVYFPVTMFNYDHEILDAATDAMDDELTVRDGLYFTGAGISLEAPKYFTSGRYYIQNIRASENRNDGAAWLQAYTENEDNKIYAVTRENATIWTLVVEGANYYLTCDINGVTNYMKVGTGANNDGYTTVKTPITLSSYSHNNQGVQLKQGDYYLCQWGSNNAQDFGGYNVNNDPGNGMRFYAVDAEGNVSDTPTTIQTTVSDVQISGTKPYNRWAYYSDSDNAQNMFYSGLVEENLVDGEIKFTVNEPGIFTFDKNDPAEINDGLKDIYQYVGLPFIKNDKGYYTFDSDDHGTYFANTIGDGKSDPWHGVSDDYFNMYFDYQKTQGWNNMNTQFGDGSSNLWAPFNTNDNDTGTGAIDYHFGMRADIPFSMTPNGCIDSYDNDSDPITFTFAGDDDVWIFIDGHLVIDLGGIHNRLGATINFADNTITYSLPPSNNKRDLPIGSFNTPEKYPLNEDGTITVKLYDDINGEGALGQTRADFSTEIRHEMSIFYLERGKGTSNCKIEFNLPMLDTVLVTKDITQSWSAAQDEEDREDGDGTAPLTAREQAAVDKLEFKFKLWKKELYGRYTAVSNARYYLLDKDGNILDILTTNDEGIFPLKNGQTAKFLTDLGRGTVTYCVEELDVDRNTFLTPDYNYRGVTAGGFDFLGETLDTESDDENATKPVDVHVSDASLVGEHELPMNATELRSYEVTPYGSIEAIESLEFICTNYLNADLPNPTARAYEDIIVIDYGLPVQVDPLANDVFRGDNIEIVAWGDESLTIGEAFVGQLGSDNNYNGDFTDLANCLYTFTEGENERWSVVGTDKNGNAVYLYPGNTTGTGYPNRGAAYNNLSISAGYEEGTFYIMSNDSDGNGNTSYLYFDRDNRRWDRVASLGDNTTWMTNCSLMLYKPAEDEGSAEIPGYERVTELTDVADGQYLVVAPGDDGNLYALYPNALATNRYCQIAKLVPTTIASSAALDSGNITFNNVLYTETPHKDENNEVTHYTFTRDSFDYELTKQLTEVETIHYIIKVTTTEEDKVGDETLERTACRYALGKVYIVPATIMYYEENFNNLVSFTNASGAYTPKLEKNELHVSPYQEPGVVGTVGDSTYGSDVAYLNDSEDSNGTSYFFDTTNGWVRFQYTFTGTGTSFFARTSATTGYMQVLLFKGLDVVPGQQIDTYYRDTYFYKDDQDHTKTHDDKPLYNIPVYTNDGLQYGTYTVVVTVATKGTKAAGPVNPNDNMKYSMHEFYLDGIRVMQPLNGVFETDVETSGSVPIPTDELDPITLKALGAYATDGESNLDVATLRHKILEEFAPEYDEDSGEELDWPFVVLTDTNKKIVKASEYDSAGPKEEVYLSAVDAAAGISNAQTVSFSLQLDQPDGLKLYMGMKAPFGHARVNVGNHSQVLNNAADCYYDVTDDYASRVTVYEQMCDEQGQPLYTDPSGEQVYESFEDGNFHYVDGDTIVEEGTELTPIDDRTKPLYYIVTYTFEAAEGIVSLTNIKAVGNYQFTILENEDIIAPGGGNEGGEDFEQEVTE